MIGFRGLLLALAIASGTSLVVACAGAALLRLVRARSIATSIVLVSLISVGAALAGVAATGAAMFLSGHDLQVLGVVLAVAAVTGVFTALVLGRSVATGSRAVGLAARRIGQAGDLPGRHSSPAPATAELAGLARELEVTSERLARTRERADALETSRRELVAWVSHDLRTPLAGMRAMAEALEDGVVDDRTTVTRYHRQIRLEVDKLAGLVDDLFELSRIHSGSMQLTLARVRLSDLVSDVVASAGPLAAAKGIRLEARGSLPEVTGSAPELGRVLANLVTNAIRYTPSDGTVEVRGDTDGSAAILSVSDSCGGIPDDELPRLFDVAFRGTAARTPVPDGGAGLGLAIARGLVEAHDGEITVANSGRGCQVVVRLPLWMGRAAAAL